MKAFPVYLFDADGTLFDTRELIFETYAALAEAWGRARPARAEVDPYIGLPLDHAAMERLLGPLAPEEGERAVAYYRDHQRNRWRQHLRLFPGVAEGVAALKAGGAKLSVVTSRRESSLLTFLDATGLRGYFDAWVTPDHTRRHKPDPEPARHALELLSARADEALFVGDAEWDVRCGHAAGTATALVAWGGMDPSGFSVRPDYFVRTFAELLPPA